MKSDLPYLLALSQIQGLGPITLKKVLDFFNDPKTCYEATFNEYLKAGLAEITVKKIFEEKNKLEPDKLIEELNKKGIKIVSIYDNEYPSLLKEIYDPPFILYYQGNINILNKISLAVIGSRNISDYAKKIMPLLLKEVVKEKIPIISGLAYGVDTLAHKISLKYHNDTLAILGSGLANIYPQSNTRLALEMINNNGLLLTEFSPESKPLPQNFVRRNRLISGLAKAVLIVEASLKSGALITAKYALEQGREILALPGNILNENSQGTNMLINEGAKLVTCSQDILDSLKRNYYVKAI